MTIVGESDSMNEGDPVTFVSGDGHQGAERGGIARTRHRVNREREEMGERHPENYVYMKVGHLSWDEKVVYTGTSTT